MSPATKLNNSRDYNAILKEYQETGNLRYLMSKYQIGRMRLRRELEERGAKLKASGDNLRAREGSFIPDDKELLDSYNSGQSLRSLSKKYGVTVCAVRHALKRCGATPRPSGYYSNTYVRKKRDFTGLAELYYSGTSVFELAEKYGVHRSTIQKHLVKLGANYRRPGREPGSIEVGELNREILEPNKELKHAFIIGNYAVKIYRNNTYFVAIQLKADKLGDVDFYEAEPPDVVENYVKLNHIGINLKYYYNWGKRIDDKDDVFPGVWEAIEKLIGGETPAPISAFA